MNLEQIRPFGNLLTLAARQAWGHRRRTLLVALCVALGNAALIFQLAQGHGQEQAFTNNMIHALSGHLQIHRSQPGAETSLFSAKLQDALPLENLDALEAAVQAQPHVAATTRRIRFGGMISSGEVNWSGFVVGAQADKERLVCDAIELDSGRFVQAGTKEIVISAAMAREHELKLGDSLTILTSTVARSFNAMEFRIVGLLSETGLSKFYSRMVYIPIEQARKLVALEEGQAYELVVRLDQTAQTDAVAARLEQALKGASGGKLGISTWVDMGGLFIGILDIGKIFRAVMAVFLGLVTLILVFSGFSVYVLERSLEVATLLAMGLRRWEVLLLLVAEGMCVAASAALIGLALGGGLSFWLGKVGIPAFNEALTYVFAGDRLYPIVQWRDLLALLLGTVAVATVAALIPVRRVLGRDLVQMLNRS